MRTLLAFLLLSSVAFADVEVIDFQSHGVLKVKTGIVKERAEYDTIMRVELHDSGLFLLYALNDPGFRLAGTWEWATNRKVVLTFHEWYRDLAAQIIGEMVYDEPPEEYEVKKLKANIKILRSGQLRLKFRFKVKLFHSDFGKAKWSEKIVGFDW
jgi:hypothetical protein